MRARDIMSRPVFTVRPDDSVEQAVALLTSKNITSAPVVDSSGDLAGMVSEADLLLRRVPPEMAAHHGRRPPLSTDRPPAVVADVMTEDVVAMPPDADLADVAKVMLDHDVRTVPIIDESAEIVGVVSRRDVLRTVVDTSDVVQMEAQHRLDEYAGGERRWLVTVSNGVAWISGECEDEVEEKIVRVLAHSTPGVAAVEFRPAPQAEAVMR